MQDIKPGIYRHYKGKEYMVFGVGFHEETHEKFVVYRALYDEYDLYVRPLALFCEETEVDGIKIPRYACIKEL